MNNPTLKAPAQLTGHWLWGSARELAAAPHEFIAHAPSAFNGLVSFRVLHKRIIAVNDPNIVRQIMVTQQQRYRRSYHYTNPVLGQGLLSTDGALWQKRRRQVQPAFRRETMLHLVRMANSTVDKLFAHWDAAKAASQPLELLSEMQKFALSVNSQALLSLDVSWDAAEKFGIAVSDALKLLRKRNNAPVRFLAWLPTPLNRQLTHTRTILEEHIAPIIKARRSQSADAPQKNALQSDILTALLDARDPETGDALSDQEILDETKTLFAAGFETTATALTWAIYLLVHNPEQAAHWYAEVDSVLAGRQPQWEDLPNLPFTANMINEVLRLYPPVYNIARECFEDDEINGMHIKKGSVLVMSILGIHRDERWWPEPLAFLPERFNASWHKHAFLPFATGRHLCVGNHFALTEMAVALICLAQRYRVELIDTSPVGMAAQITLVPNRPLHFKLLARP
ncbi:MAG TPA: cytochrome P450 [Cellvibrionaceae bacterium]|nr:cytochrome P450 [Cellvibrionaceae bacterium]